MSNKNLFKEAIADAKAVREAALANAKAALEEALTPKLQSMLAARLNEMEEYEEYEELEEMGKKEDEMEEGFTTSHGDDSDENLDFNLEEEFDLSEILAELEDDEKEELEEAKKEEKEKEDKKKKKMMKEAEEGEEEEEEEEAEEVADMTVEDLKALIKDLIAQEMGDEGEEEAGDEMSMDMGGEEEAEEETVSLDEEEINLEELLAELDSLDEANEKKEKMKSKKKELDEIDLGKIGAGIKRMVTGDQECAAEAEEADPSKPGNYYGPKAVAKSDKWWAAFNACRKAKGRSVITKHTAGQAFGVKETQEMQEAINTINTLRAELNEVNLLNAKLLYVNKIFKAKNLTESQKLQVIASFDKATTAKEAKVVYESLNATLTSFAPKQAIKESLGFASKAAGVAPKKAIVESNDVITRMQKLANIIK